MPRLPSLLRLPTKLHRRARRSRMFTLLFLLSLLTILILPFYVVYKPPNLLIRYFQWRWPDVLFHVPLPGSKTTSGSTRSNSNSDGNGRDWEKIVALTIDDAPSSYTKEILEVLRENEAKATFFVIGSQVAGREDILVDVVREGHELGNHAMYDEPSRSLDDETLETQIRAVGEMIEKAYTTARTKSEAESKPDSNIEIPSPPHYFRPGSGLFSTRLLSITKKLGYKTILGSIYPHDPQIPYPSINARHILSMVRPGGIIICHDRRSWTVPMLKRVLPELGRRGYRVVGVSELVREGERRW